MMTDPSETKSAINSLVQLQRVRREAAVRETELQREAEAAHTRSEMVLASIRDAFSAFDRDWRYNYINDQGLEMTGLRRADFIGRTLWEVFPDLAGTEFEAQLQRAMEGREAVTFEHYYPAWGRWLENRAYPSADGLSLFTSDISERKAAEEQLRKSREQYRLITDALPALISYVDSECRYRFNNRAYTNWFGHTSAELYGKHLVEVLGEEAYQAVRPFVDAVLSGQAVSFEATLNYKGGGPRYVHVNYVPDFGAQGQVRGYYALINDLSERHRTEEAVRESEESYRVLAETASDAIIRIDENSTIQFVNTAAERIFGYAPAALIGQSLTLLMPEEIRQKHRFAGIRRYLQTGQRKLNWESIEVPARHKDGRQFPLEISFGEYRHDGKRFFIGIARDITQRKQAEEDARLLADLGERLSVAEDADVLLAETARAVAEHLQVARCLFVEIDQARNQGVIRHQYPPHLAPFADVYQLSEYSPLTLAEVEAGHSVVNCDAQTDPRTAAYYEKAYRQTGERAYIAVPLRRTGRWVATLWASTEQPRAWQPRELTLLETIAERVWLAVEKLRLDAEMRASEEKFRDMADNIAQFAWMADAQGWIFWYNQRWYDYTGTTLAEMQGWGWRKVHHPDHVDRVVKRIQHSWDTGEVWEDLFPLRSKDGAYRWFLSRALPIRDAAGKVLRWFGTHTDVTEQRAAEEALREADRRKDEFLSVISHELRSPLNAILGWTGVLSSQHKADPEIQKITAIIQRNGRTQIQLIEDLLDTARIISGKLKLDTRPVEVREVLTAALDNVRPAAESKNITLSVSFEPAPEAALEAGVSSSQVMADADRLQQVFWNLLSNAVKFTPAGGRVQVTLKRAEAAVLIAIRDTGQGISPAFLPHVFDRFRQSDSSSSRRFGGLGLGLALVRHLTEMHGGQVTVESAGEGQGATFTVRLPLQSALQPGGAGNSAAQQQAVEASESFLASVPLVSNALVGVRVLVVDDDEAASELVTLTLRQAGAQVAGASTAAAALAALEAAAPDAPFDLLLSDIGMPGTDGYELLQQVRAHATPRVRNVRAVALTAYARLDDRLQALQAGYQTHLAKPIEEDELITVVASVTGRL